jgi:hypothetical protein
MPTSQISSDAVKSKTGKTWEEWFAQLDASSCATMNHKEIVDVVKNKFHVQDWWQQMITVSYEQARGKRLLNQRPEGFQFSKSRTLNTDLDKAFKAWTDKTDREKWLTDPDITIRKATQNHTLRITWVDEITSVDVSFLGKNDKVQVVVNHRKLPNPQKVEEMKKYWAEQLDKLANFLER